MNYRTLSKQIKSLMKNAAGLNVNNNGTWYCERVLFDASDLKKMSELTSDTYFLAYGKYVQNNSDYIRTRAMIKIDVDVLKHIDKLTVNDVELEYVQAKQLYFKMVMRGIGEVLLNTV